MAMEQDSDNAMKPAADQQHATRCNMTHGVNHACWTLSAAGRLDEEESYMLPPANWLQV